MKHSYHHTLTTLFFLLLCSLSLHSQGQSPYRVTDDPSDYDYLTATAEETAAGEEWVVTFSFDTEVNYTAFQMDLTMSDALSAFTSSELFLADGRAGDTHVLTSSMLRGGKRRVVCYASDAAPFTAREGDLFYLVLTAKDPVPEGTYTLTASNIRFSTTTGKEKTQDNVTITINATATAILPTQEEHTSPTFWNLNGTRSTYLQGIQITQGSKRLIRK